MRAVIERYSTIVIGAVGIAQGGRIRIILAEPP